MTRTAAVLAAVVAAFPAAAADPKEVAAAARGVFAAHCHKCHGKDGSSEGGFDYVLDAEKLVREEKVVPGKPDGSLLLTRMTAARKPMPPEKVKDRPTAAEVGQVRAWIAAGSPAFPAAPAGGEAGRAFVNEDAVLRAVKADLEAAHPAHARFRRYFSLAPQFNASPAAVPAADLRLFHAGVAKLLNSLSWRKPVVRPRILLDGAVLAIDLRDLDWDETGAWDQILARYPYGLKHDRYPEADGLPAVARAAYKLAGTDLPVVRADWFLATVSTPPLYHDLLRLPRTAGELEAKLGVDVAANLGRDRAARAGFAKSGVSNQNRLIERHDGTHGAYWKSYDFKSETGAGRLAAFPLGPRFPGNPYPDLAFAHDGGEIVFTLPNGLQGYMLVDAAGRRIDEGPADVVRDADESAGRNTLIVNGLSCMACHARGVKRDFTETVRDGAGVGGEARDKVRRLHPLKDALDAVLKADEARFLAAVDEVCGPYLKVGADAGVAVDRLPEPIGAFAKPFLRDQLTAADGARELGLQDADRLRTMIGGNDDLKGRLGLRPWVAPNGTISRRHWEEVRGLTSVFQDAAAILDRGEPKNVRR